MKQSNINRMIGQALTGGKRGRAKAVKRLLNEVVGRKDVSGTSRDDEREAQRRWKGCESKNRYATRAAAMEAIAQCAAHGTTGLRCYKCDYCSGWHLTSQPPRN